MLNWIKNKLGVLKEPNEETTDYDFRWYEVGDEENPFNKRVLDIRPFTHSVISGSTDVFGSAFGVMRQSDGKNHIGQKIENENFIETNLEYPHNGEMLDGVIFKSEEMECKWDIYIYDNCFYFARSWSGELWFKAQAEFSDNKLLIKKIFFDEEGYNEEVVNDVHFLMKSHAFNQPFPHKILDLSGSEMLVAQVSFKLHGNRACYACFDDITDTTITKSL